MFGFVDGTESARKNVTRKQRVLDRFALLKCLCNSFISIDFSFFWNYIGVVDIFENISRFLNEVQKSLQAPVLL